MTIIKYIKKHILHIKTDIKFKNIMTQFESNRVFFPIEEIKLCFKLCNKFYFYRAKDINKAIGKLELLEVCITNRISQIQK